VSRNGRTLAIWLSACLAGGVLFIGVVYGDEYRTPLAGEAYHTELFGRQVDVPPRDRRHVTAANFGVQWIPNGPSQLELLPFGALYIWRNRDDERRRFRGTFSGVVNDVNFNIGSKSLGPWEILLTFDNFILPLGRSEYVEGQRIQEVEVQWNYAYAGIGISYRKPLPPGHQDSALEISLTYEPGFLWFQRSKGTSPNFVVPSDTYEGRVRLRARVDTLDRNLIELPHRGFTFGGDLWYGHRANWQNWGGVPPFQAPDFRSQRDYLAASMYALAAGGVPFVNSERHRLIASLYGGIGKDLDRFSAFRLPGRPTGYEWEAIALPLMPAAAFNEFFPSRYGIANLDYRFEALFFMFPYIRGTWAVIERLRFTPNGISNQMNSLPALGAGLVSGAPWRSQVELNYAYNFGMFRDPGGGPPTLGGHGFFILWSKEL
jgi:hypothetical protein